MTLPERVFGDLLIVEAKTFGNADLNTLTCILNSMSAFWLRDHEEIHMDKVFNLQELKFSSLWEASKKSQTEM